MAGTSGGNTSNWYGCKYGDTVNKIIEEFSVFPTAQEVGISWPGHQLLSWNSAADGTGITYQIGDSGVQADANYYAQWDYIGQEDLIISNHSLIDIGDAIRQKNLQSLSSTSLTIPNMITEINNIETAVAPVPWYNSVVINAAVNNGYSGCIFNCSQYITDKSDYWLSFIATNGSSSSYYRYYFVPSLNSSHPYYATSSYISSTTSMAPLTGNYESAWGGPNSNITITTSSAGYITIVTNQQNAFGNKRQILLMYK